MGWGDETRARSAGSYEDGYRDGRADGEWAGEVNLLADMEARLETAEVPLIEPVGDVDRVTSTLTAAHHLVQLMYEDGCWAPPLGAVGPYVDLFDEWTKDMDL